MSTYRAASAQRYAEETAGTEPNGAGRLTREAARARAGTLFSTYGDEVKRICRAVLRDRVEAEDASQQTFLSAYRALLGGTEPREPAAWLATIARNECRRRIRTGMRAPVAAQDMEWGDTQADVHREAVSNLDAARLRREIRRLPSLQRDAILLREFAGLSYDELANELGVSRPAIHSLLFRARTTLRQQLRTAFAALNLGAVASTLNSALGRLLGGGVAPRLASMSLAGKAVALTLGGAIVVGGAVVGERALTGPAHLHAPVVLPAVPDVGQRDLRPYPGVSFPQGSPRGHAPSTHQASSAPAGSRRVVTPNSPVAGGALRAPRRSTPDPGAAPPASAPERQPAAAAESEPTPAAGETSVPDVAGQDTAGQDTASAPDPPNREAPVTADRASAAKPTGDGTAAGPTAPPAATVTAQAPAAGGSAGSSSNGQGTSSTPSFLPPGHGGSSPSQAPQHANPDAPGQNTAAGQGAAQAPGLTVAPGQNSAETPGPSIAPGQGNSDPPGQSIAPAQSIAPGQSIAQGSGQPADSASSPAAAAQGNGPPAAGPPDASSAGGNDQQHASSPSEIPPGESGQPPGRGNSGSPATG